MRCPKCATSFMVEKPTADEPGRGSMETMVGVAPRVARPSSSLKQTMIGVAGPDLVRAAASAAKPRATESTTMKDLPAPLRASAEPAPSDTDLPAPAPVKADLPARPQPSAQSPALPQASRAKPPPPVRRAEALDSELPAALSFGKSAAQKPAARNTGVTQPNVPRPSPPRAVASQPEATRVSPGPPARQPVPGEDELELPALATEPPLVKPVSLHAAAVVSALPMPAAPLPVRQAAFEIDLNLSETQEPEPAVTARAQAAADDLEIDLPSPLSARETGRADPAIGQLDFDLDLPSPSMPPAGGKRERNSISAAPDAPPGGGDSLAFGEVEIPTSNEFDLESSGFGMQGAKQTSEIALIPDLDAALGTGTEKSAGAGPTAGTGAGQPGVALSLPDLTDALPVGSAAPNTVQAARPLPSAAQGDLGELEIESRGGFVGEIGAIAGQGPASVPKRAPVARTSGGGGTDFGEVSLDIGSDVENAIATLDDDSGRRDRQISADLEFGGIPQENVARPAAATDDGGQSADTRSVPVQRKRPERAQRESNLPPRSRSARCLGLAALVVVVLGGSALSLVPDVGLFGSAYISDQLRKSEYDRLLASQSSLTQRALAIDVYPDGIKALQQRESQQKAYPRARELKAYFAVVAYAIDLRFGPSPERSSMAKVLLSQLTPHDAARTFELAEAAKAADERNLTRAHQRIDEIRRANPKRIEVQVLSAQIEMLDRRPGQSLVYWRELESVERSARSAFGSATAELALGQIEAAELSAKAALDRQPRHIGARLLMARIALEKRGDSDAAEKTLRAVEASGADASPAELVAMHTMLGDLALSRTRISAAEAAYARALASDPRCSAALRGLGEALYRTGRFSEALARFEAAVQADPDDSTAAVGVAKSQLSLERVREAVALLSRLLATHAESFLVNYWYGGALEADGNREGAEKAFSKAVDLGGNEPGAIDAYVSLALLKNQQGRREEAQKLLDAARAKLPLSAKLLVAIGQLALSEGRYEAAIADFRKALELEPTDIAARFRLGVALRKHRKFDEAMASFEEVAKLDAGFPGLALERGLLFETSGRTDEALRAFEDALAKAPNDPDLMLRVGCGKVAAGRRKEAEVLLRKVLDQRHMSAETHHCLGRAQLLEGTNLALALRTLERAVELDPYRPEYYLYVGWAANEAGRIGVAEQALKKAIALDQGLGDAYWQRGVLRFRQGAIKDAVVDLTKAIELRPSRFEAHAALAEAYYELGLEVKALEQWRVAVQAQPENASWHFSYGKLLQAMNRDTEARTELEQALTLGAKLDPGPRWIWEAHRLLARSLGLQASAVPHWQAYLRLAPLDHAYRDEAKQALARLGQPWEEGR